MTQSNAITNKSRMIKNTAFLYLRMIITIVIGLYASRVVLDVLGESDFGIFSLVGGIVIVLSFLNSGMLQASQRFISYALGKDDDDLLNKTFWASWYAHAILALAIIAIAEIFGVYIVNEVLSIPASKLYAANIVYQCSVMTCAVSVLSVPYNSTIIAHEHMGVFAHISILEAVLKLLIIYLLLVISFDKLILYAILMFVVQSLIRLCYTIYCKARFSECSSRRVFDRGITMRIMSFAGWSFLGNFGITLKDQGMNMLYNIFFQSTIVNAARGIATQVNGIISTFATNITMAINPQIIKNFSSGNIEASMSITYLGCRISFYMLTMIVLPFILNVDYILHLWLANVPENTDLFLYFILAFSLVYSLSQPITVGIQATGKVKDFQIWIFVLMMLELLTCYVVLRITGSLLASLFPTVIFAILAAAARIIILKRLTPSYQITTYLSDVILRCTVVLALSYAASRYIHQMVDYDNLWLFLAECGMIVMAVLCITLAFGFKTTEYRQIARLIRKR